MLPKKAIVAVIIASLLILGYEGLNEKQASELPNLLLGFGLVGAINAVWSLKEIVRGV